MERVHRRGGGASSSTTMSLRGLSSRARTRRSALRAKTIPGSFPAPRARPEPPRSTPTPIIPSARLTKPGSVGLLSRAAATSGASPRDRHRVDEQRAVSDAEPDRGDGREAHPRKHIEGCGNPRGAPAQTALPPKGSPREKATAARPRAAIVPAVPRANRGGHLRRIIISFMMADDLVRRAGPGQARRASGASRLAWTARQHLAAGSPAENEAEVANRSWQYRPTILPNCRADHARRLHAVRSSRRNPARVQAKLWSC